MARLVTDWAWVLAGSLLIVAANACSDDAAMDGSLAGEAGSPIGGRTATAGAAGSSGADDGGAQASAGGPGVGGTASGAGGSNVGESGGGGGVPGSGEGGLAGAAVMGGGAGDGGVAGSAAAGQAGHGGEGGAPFECTAGTVSVADDPDCSRIQTCNPEGSGLVPGPCVVATIQIGIGQTVTAAAQLASAVEITIDLGSPAIGDTMVVVAMQGGTGPATIVIPGGATQASFSFTPNVLGTSQITLWVDGTSTTVNVIVVP